MTESEARALAEDELQFVVHARGRAAGSERSAVGAVEDQGDRRRVDVEEHHAGLTQPVGGLYPTPAVDGGEQLLVRSPHLAERWGRVALCHPYTLL